MILSYNLFLNMEINRFKIALLWKTTFFFKSNSIVFAVHLSGRFCRIHTRLQPTRAPTRCSKFVVKNIVIRTLRKKNLNLNKMPLNYLSFTEKVYS